MTYSIKQIHKLTELKHKLLPEYQLAADASLACLALNEAFPHCTHTVIAGNVKLEVQSENELPREGYHP